MCVAMIGLSSSSTLHDGAYLAHRRNSTRRLGARITQLNLSRRHKIKSQKSAMTIIIYTSRLGAFFAFLAYFTSTRGCRGGGACDDCLARRSGAF